MIKVQKIAVYTCITGNYDELKEIDKKLLEKDIDYYCFTNNKNIKSNTWKIIYIEDFSLTNHMLNRKIKMLGHELINNYDILVWIDGNVSLKKKITTFLKEQCNLEKYPFCAFKHPDRNCIYDEATACVRLKKDKKDIIVKQMEFYKKDNYPRNNGLCEMAIFVKKPKDRKVIETMKLWYEMLNKYSKRDQLSFMWCVTKTSLDIEILPLIVNDNKYFSRISHFKDEKSIDTYRLYFGDSTNFQIERVIDGEYEINDNNYNIKNIIVPIDTQRIELFVCNISGVEFSNLNIKTTTKITTTIHNYTVISDKTYFFNNGSKIIVEGDFKKGQSISISLDLKIITLEEWISIAHDCEEQKNRYLNQKNTEAEEFNKIKNDLDNRIKELEKELSKVLNSKGWQTLEKLRKIKGSNK